MGWPGICDLVHVALLQGDCEPPQATDNVVAFLPDNSWAAVSSINGSMYCTAVAVGVEDTIDSSLSLRATPNPTHANTSISFVLAKPGLVRVEVVDLAGRRISHVVDQALPAGPHSFAWNGRDSRGITVAAGVYLIVVQTPAHRAVQRVAVLR